MNSFSDCVIDFTSQKATTPPVEGDVGGSGAEVEDGVAPMDSDTAALEEGQKQSPEGSELEAGQIEGEADAEAEVEGESEATVKSETVAEVRAV